ncbi:MAG: hypothetical protein ACI9O1_000336 [Candidatus Thalassarchaeaceae archaeon]|jgi:septum formation inhibitor-activating ATPase MinD
MHHPALASQMAKRPPNMLPNAGSKYTEDVTTFVLIKIISIIPNEQDSIPAINRNNFPLASMLQANCMVIGPLVNILMSV